MKFRKSILLSTAVTGLWAGPAVAQEATDEQISEDDSFGTIIVTARRKEEDAQDVPQTIAAFSGEDLAKQDITNVSDLVNDVPGVVFCCQRGEVQFPFIRGVPGVKGYFAEVPAVLDGSAYYFDLENVQVLKGPQGTLFGTATNGGAILNEPHRPDSDFGGYVAATLGDYGRKSVEGVINVPLSDAVAIRAGALWNKSNGYIHDGTTGQTYGNEDYYIARFGLNIDTGTGFENYFVVNYHNSKGDRPPFTPWAANPAAAVYPRLQPIIEQQRILGPYDLVGTSIPGGNMQERKMLNIVNQTKVELSDSLTLRNIIGYSTYNSFTRFDADGTPLRIFDNNYPPTQAHKSDRSISEELQLQGEIGDRFDFTLGTFHLWNRAGKANGTDFDDLRDSFGILTGNELFEDSTTTHAVFGEGTYNFQGDGLGLNATLGLRYTKDSVKLRETNSVWVILPSGDFLDLATVNAVPHTDTDLSTKFSKTTFKAGLQYIFERGRMAYFTVSRGYSSGGFDPGNPPGLEAFQPESLTNYELGVKADWSDGDLQVRTNAAIFLGKYNDIQVSTTNTTCTNPNDLTTCNFTVGTFNAAKADVKGAEVQFSVSPIRAIDLGVNFSYNKNTYTDFIDDPDGPGPQPAIDKSDVPFVYNPKYKANIFGAVHFPLERMGELSFSLNYTYQSQVNNSAVQDPQYYDIGPARDNLDLSAEWTDMFGQDGLTGLAFITNVTKNVFSDGGFGAYRQLGLWGRNVAPPRQFGFKMRYEF